MTSDHQEHTEMQRLRAERDHLMRQNMVLRNRVAELEKGSRGGLLNPASPVPDWVQELQKPKEQDK